MKKILSQFIVAILLCGMVEAQERSSGGTLRISSTNADYLGGIHYSQWAKKTNELVVGQTSIGGTFTGNGFGLTNMLTATFPTERQWNIKEQFGARGDGATIASAVVTSNSPVVTITTGVFTTNDIGKKLMVWHSGEIVTNLFLRTNIVAGVSTNVYALGTTNWLHVTGTITNVASANVASVNTLFTHTTTNKATYGTDDTEALQTGLNYVGTNGGGTLFFPNGIYIVGGAIQDPGPVATRTNHNAQLTFPEITQTGFSITQIRLEGPQFAGQNQAIIGVSTPNTYGAWLWSVLPDAAGGSFFDCKNLTSPTYTHGSRYIVRYNPVIAEFRNIGIRTAWDADIIALNLEGASNCRIENTMVDSGYALYNTPPLSKTNGFGIKLPGISNGAFVVVKHISVCGFWSGIGGSEHLSADGVQIADCWWGVDTVESETGGHHGEWRNLDFENTHCFFRGDLSVNVLIAWITCEAPFTNVWTYPPMLIHDPLSVIRGTLIYRYGSENIDLPRTGGTGVSVGKIGPFSAGIRWERTSTMDTLSVSNIAVKSGITYDISGGAFDCTVNSNTYAFLNYYKIGGLYGGVPLWQVGFNQVDDTTGLYKRGDWGFYSWSSLGFNTAAAAIGTNGYIKARAFQIRTNDSVVPPLPNAGFGTLWNSNNVLYWVTPSATNQIAP